MNFFEHFFSRVRLTKFSRSNSDRYGKHTIWLLPANSIASKNRVQPQSECVFSFFLSFVPSPIFSPFPMLIVCLIVCYCSVHVRRWRWYTVAWKSKHRAFMVYEPGRQTNAPLLSSSEAVRRSHTHTLHTYTSTHRWTNRLAHIPAPVVFDGSANYFSAFSRECIEWQRRAFLYKSASDAFDVH